MTHFLRSINLLELIGLRETFFLLDYQFFTKDVNQQPDEDIQRVRYQKEELLSWWSLGPSVCHMEAFCFPSLEAL